MQQVDTINFTTPFDSFFQEGLIQSLLSMAILLVTLFILNIVANYIIKNYFEKHVNILRKIKKIILWIIFFASLFNQFKSLSSITTGLLASGGVIAVMLGLASQEAASSLLSGLIIVIFKPYRIGDYIKVNDYDVTGFVKDISLRHTTIETIEKTLVIIPNTNMNKSVIENINAPERKASFFIVDIAYDSNLDKACEIIKEEIIKHPLTIQEDASVLTTAFKDSGIELKATIFSENAQDAAVILSDLRKSVKRRFDEENIDIPYQHVVVINK